MQTELELSDAIAERNEIHGHLTSLERTRSGLESDLETLSVTLDEKTRLVDQLNQDKEGLTKENAEMEVIAGARFIITTLMNTTFGVQSLWQQNGRFSTPSELRLAHWFTFLHTPKQGRPGSVLLLLPPFHQNCVLRQLVRIPCCFPPNSSWYLCGPLSSPWPLLSYYLCRAW